jgi:hypothetical protein
MPVRSTKAIVHGSGCRQLTMGALIRFGGATPKGRPTGYASAVTLE